MNDYRTIELLKELKALIIGQPKKDKWIDINEASEYTSVSSSTLRRNIKDGKLKASKKLGKILFKKSDLESWLNE